MSNSERPLSKEAAIAAIKAHQSWRHYLCSWGLAAKSEATRSVRRSMTLDLKNRGFEVTREDFEAAVRMR